MISFEPASFQQAEPTSIYRFYILFDYRQPNLVLQGPSGPDPTTRGFSKFWQRPVSLRSL